MMLRDRRKDSRKKNDGSVRQTGVYKSKGNVFVESQETFIVL